MKIILYTFILLNSFNLSAATLTTQIKQPNHHVLLRAKSEIVEFRPNSSLHWGVKLSLDYFYFQYGQKFKDTNYSGRSVGNDSYKDYRIGVSSKNTFTELIYKEWIGFSSNESDSSLEDEAESNGVELNCDYCLDRFDLSSRERYASFLYALNEDFSMKALNNNGSEGVEFSHSWLLSINASRLKIFSPAGIIQSGDNDNFINFQQTSSFEMKQIGIAGGYGLLFPYESFYGGLAGLLGAGYQENKRVSLENDLFYESGIGAQVIVKAMIATHGKGMNYGLKGFFFSNIYQFSEDETIASLNYSLYLYSSYTW